MTTSKTSETAAKKDVAKLQRAIVDGLEDVKAQDIQVFNTEHLSPLFERVIVASGTSNRQTKAIAASVRDKVKDAGFPKPRTEGEDNGEWIIVDCGAAVAHIMQPTIRQYYRLEDLWGEMPVRLKLGAAKPTAPEAKVPVKTAARRAAKAAEAEGAASGKKAPARKPASGRSSSAVGTAGRKTPARSAARPGNRTDASASASTNTRARPVSAVKPSAQSAAKSAAKAPMKTPMNVPAKTSAKTSAKAPAKAAPVKTVVVKPRSAAAPAKKAAPAKRAAPAKSAATKAPARKAPGRNA